MSIDPRQKALRLRIRARTIAIAFLIVASLGVVCWVAGRSSDWERLHNGWHVRFDGLSLGRSHGYPPGNLILQYLHRSPRPWMIDHFGFKPITVYCGDGQRENLCFWLRWRCPPEAGDNVVEMLADDTGHESQAFQGGIGMSAPGNTLLYTHLSYVWPSSRRIALRLYEHQPDGDLVPLAEFQVKNPGHSLPRAEWIPESLPAISTNGDLTVVFEGFGHGPLPARPHWNRQPTSRPLPFIRLRTLENGNPSSGWQVRQVTLSDGAANDLSFETFSFPTNGIEIVPLTTTTSEAAEVPRVLWPGPKAWKLRFVLGIRPGAHFPTNEVCTRSSLGMNAGDSGVSHREVTWGRFNVTVMVHQERDTYANWMPNANRLLEIFLDQHLPDVMLAVVDMHDDQGRPIAIGPAHPNSYGYHGEKMNTHWSIPFLLEPDARDLTVSFGVKTNRVIEFVVPSPDFPSAKPFAVSR